MPRRRTKRAWTRNVKCPGCGIRFRPTELVAHEKSPEHIVGTARGMRRVAGWVRLSRTYADWVREAGLPIEEDWSYATIRHTGPLGKDVDSEPVRGAYTLPWIVRLIDQTKGWSRTTRVKLLRRCNEDPSVLDVLGAARRLEGRERDICTLLGLL